MQHRYYTIIFTSILFCTLSILSASWLYEKLNDTIIETLDNYDYIIVGGGTAGCVLASKLSENNSNTVLLIESGHYFNIISSVPLLTVMMQGTQYDWSFKSMPQKFSSFGLHNQTQSLPRGKGLGGSNQINYMVHGDDIESDLEKWMSLDIEGWEFQKLAPYIQNIFKNKESLLTKKICSEQCKPYSSFNISVTKSELGDLFQKAAQELKQKDIKHNYGHSTINDGRRWTSYHNYLKPVINRDNLHVLLNTHVTKIVFNNKHAVGVQFIDNTKNRKIIYSKNDIILSSGAFNTPQILLLSGIGPENVLRNFRIPMVFDLPGVGKNLHDHLNIPLYVSINKSLSVTADKVLRLSEFWNYLVYKKGLLSQSPVAGFVRKSDVGVLLFGMGSTDEKILREVSNLKFETFTAQFPFYKNSSQEGFVLLSTCLKPKSRGFVSIKNSDFNNLAVINPQYLSKYQDIECMIRAVKLAEALMNTAAFQSIGSTIHWPEFENCKDIPLNSNSHEYLECIIRTASLTAYHPGGTCRMGSIKDRLTVVDHNLRVKGVTGLRIMDASILPEPLSTFPNSVLIAMAEYAADLITNKI